MAKKSTKSPVSEPRLWKTIFQVRYKPTLAFYKRLFVVAEKFDEYPDWKTDGLRVVVHDFVKHCSLGIAHKSSTYDQDTDTFDDQEQYIENMLTRIPEDLKIPFYTRLGLRRQYLAESLLGYEELVAILNVKLFSQEESLIKFLPSETKDLTYRVNFTEGNLHIHITAGSMKREEIPNWIQFNKQVHLDPRKAGKDYLQVIEQYPDVAVFYDIDIWREEENIPTTEASTFFSESHIKIEAMINNFQDYCFAREVSN